MRRPLAQLLGVVATALIASAASAQTNLAIEFNEDDQTNFDVWPVPLSGSYMVAQFGAVTVEVSTNTSFAHPTDRGSTNGNPPGYSYQHLYEDLLHAFTPTGTMTLDFSGLQPSAHYTFILYAWDPGTSSGTHEWTITGGSAVPPAITADWSTPLTDNDTFALEFDVTTTAGGTFQIDNTAGLGGSAINGFKLIAASGPIGTNYCGPANLNSTGQSAVMSAFGSETAGNNDVRIDASGTATNQFSMFVNSQAQGFVMPPGSQGNLCLSGAIGRYNQSLIHTGAAGIASLQLDLTNTPTPGGLYAIQPGETWNFQLWFRDQNSGPTSNFTDGVSITFQ